MGLKRSRSKPAPRRRKSTDSAISSCAPVVGLTGICRRKGRETLIFQQGTCRFLFVELDNRDHGTAAMWALMHGIDRDEHGWIADRRRRHAADRRLGVPVVMDVGIVEHDLT